MKSCSCTTRYIETAAAVAAVCSRVYTQRLHQRNEIMYKKNNEKKNKNDFEQERKKWCDCLLWISLQLQFTIAGENISVRRQKIILLYIDKCLHLWCLISKRIYEHVVAFCTVWIQVAAKGREKNRIQYDQQDSIEWNRNDLRKKIFKNTNIMHRLHVINASHVYKYIIKNNLCCDVNFTFVYSKINRIPLTKSGRHNQFIFKNKKSFSFFSL